MIPVRSLVATALLTCTLACHSEHAHAQALATATGPGSYISVGGGVSGVQTDYGRHRVPGGFLYADVNPSWRVGLEAEARFAGEHNQERITERTYLVGPRVVLSPKPSAWSPYAKFLVGAGEITLPYGYAHGGFLTYAAGAGADVSLNDRLSVRVVDFEYQHWPDFPYGPLHPYGVSAGVSLRLNAVSRYPKGSRSKH